MNCDYIHSWLNTAHQSSTPINMGGIVEMHDTVFFYLIVISLLLCWLLGAIMIKFSSNNNKVALVHNHTSDGTLIDTIWTITPALFLMVAVGLPGFKLLSLMDESITPNISVKAVGDQWYWSYQEYTLPNNGIANESDSTALAYSNALAYSGSLLNQDSTPMIPWVETSPMAQGRKLLERMASHYPQGHDVSQFLKRHAAHLLSLPVGDTGIPSNLFDPEVLASNPDVIKLDPLFTKRNFSNTSGVYYAFTTEGGYVGSATNQVTRWDNHYAEIADGHNSKFHTAVRNWDGIGSFNFFSPKLTPDYMSMFRLEHPGSLLPTDNVVKSILRIYTQFEARIYEQAVISHLAPLYNDDHIVAFTSNWNPQTAKLGGQGHPIQALGLHSGETYYFTGKREASRFLNIITLDMGRITNYAGYWRTSDTLGEPVSFIDVSTPMKVGSPHKLPKDLLPQIDYFSIPDGEVWAFSDKFEFLSKDNGLGSAAKPYGVSKQTAVRNVNRIFCEATLAGLPAMIYFARNLNPVSGTPPNPITVVDSKDNITRNYVSIAEFLKENHPNPKNARSTDVVRRLGKLYMGRWTINYTKS